MNLSPIPIAVVAWVWLSFVLLQLFAPLMLAQDWSSLRIILTALSVSLGPVLLGLCVALWWLRDG